MYQELANSQASSFTFSRDPQWSSVLGPVGPMPTYAMQPSQTLQSGQDAATNTCTPQRQPRDSGAKQGAEGNGYVGRERGRSMDEQKEVREFLARAHLDEVRIGWLIDEGFVSRDTLELLDSEDMEALIESKRDEGPIPLMQCLALKKLGRALNNDSKGSGAPRNPQRTPESGNNPRSGDSQAVWDPCGARMALGGQWGTDTSNTRLDYQDPTLIMRMQGKSVTFHDITEYIPGFLVEKVRVAIPGSEGKVILETGPKRPALHKVTLGQWNCANARILDTLILEGAININSIPDYLAYTQKINRLHERFEWETVLLYDREYRQLQATVGMRWGVDVRHLSDVHLREKVYTPSQGQTRRDRQAKATGGRQRANATDPKTGQEICLNFNRGQCYHKDCKFVHICTQCFESHAASTHSQLGNEKRH